MTGLVVYHPVLAAVLSVLLAIVGAAAVFELDQRIRGPR